MPRSPEEIKLYQKRWAAENPEKMRQYAKTYTLRNKEKRLASWRDYNKRNKATIKVKRVWMKDVYGITFDQYQKMLQKQHFQCAICAKMHGDNRYTKLTIDHDHNTNKVRSLLCRKCNIMLGHADDKPEVLRRAASYIEEHNA